MTRALRQSSQIAIDACVLALALWLAFALRFEADIPFDMTRRLVFLTPYVVAFQYGVLFLLAVPRFSWRHVGLREAGRIGQAVLLSNAVLLVARLVAAGYVADFPRLRYLLIPIGVIVADAALAFLGLTGVRALRRVRGERADAKARSNSERKVRTLVVGAGNAGLLVAREIAAHPNLGMLAVGFVDDDPQTHGTVIHGVAVMGSTSDVARLATKHDAEQALIAIASATGADIRRINGICEKAGLSVRIIPGLSELVGGQVNLNRIRKVAIEDLLRRPPVSLDDTAISEAVKGKTVVITGAGGSIGSELCRQVSALRPRLLILVDYSENNLFFIHRELTRQANPVPVVPALVSIRDTPGMRSLFESHRPDLVFHAAAFKHVPMLEWNPAQAILTNIEGTQAVAELASEFGVEAFVMISTDKAVRPTSVMGASKRVAELLVQSLAARSKTRFTTVRFGNVLGSAGSVVPLFKAQIAAGGPVTVTHPEMRRYFMTIPEACQLVLQAATMGQGADIFILDMGEPVKIVDLAQDLIRLSGFQPNDEIRIEFTGVRPGEKLFEELSSEEDLDRTAHPKIMIERGEPPERAQVQEAVVDLGEAARRREYDGIRDRLKQLIPSCTLESAPVEEAESANKPALSSPPPP
jgi:FlaA1/EpsC-like NDP-sugar epimerase